MNYNNIFHNLWLGNYISAKDKEFMKNNKILLVVNCTKDLEEPEFYRELGIKMIRLPINDINTPDNIKTLEDNMDNYLEIVKSYIDGNKGVLIHCYAGISRSATTVASYLIKYYKFKPDLAIFYIQNKRPIAFTPRPMFDGFLKQYYEKKLKI